MSDLDMSVTYKVWVLKTPKTSVKSDNAVFTSEHSLRRVRWSGDSPSQIDAWKDVDGKRTPCTFHLGWGFMTDDEIWEEKQKYPRDCF